MTKQSGLGDNFYIGGYNISGDVGSLGSISCPLSPLEDTGIDKLAMERLGGLRSGHIEFSAFFNTSAGQEHAALKTLPTASTIATYFRGTTVGDPAFALQGKQLNYDPVRGADGSLVENVTVESDQYGGEWGIMLTAGVRSLSGTSGSGTSVDTGASLSFGAQMYVQVFSFTGTDAEIRFQDSADDSSFGTVGSLNPTITTAPYTTRVATSNTATIRRYIRVTVPTGTFTQLSFAVMVIKNEIAGQVF